MNHDEVVQQMKLLKGAGHAAHPDSAWVNATRSRLLQHIYQTTEEIPTRVLTLNRLWLVLSLILPQRTVYAVVRPAFIFVLCFGLGTAGWITTVTASLESLPGDALYPVKIATEQTQVAVAQAFQGNEASAGLRVSFATRRADEVTKAIAAPASNDVEKAEKQERVERAVENLKSEVQTVNDQLKEVKQENPQAAIRVAQVIERKVDVLQQSLEVGGAHASSTAPSAVAAIAELKLEVGRTKIADISAPIATTTSTPTASTSTTVPLGGKELPAAAPTTTSTTTTITIIAPIATTTPITIFLAPIPVASVEPTLPEKPTNDFPERPSELSPEVVDAPTPISIQSWD